jgi:hypothetical protein
MNYQIAVPSYKRYEILKTQTLPTLDKLKADRDKIHIFVANEEEAEKYKDAIGDNYRIVVGQRGISTQRKYIHNYFADDERVVSFDDDVMVMTTAGTPYHQVGEYFNIRDNWTRKFLGIAVVIGTFDGSKNRKTGEVPDDDIEQVVLK